MTCEIIKLTVSTVCMKLNTSSKRQPYRALYDYMENRKPQSLNADYETETL